MPARLVAGFQAVALAVGVATISAVPAGAASIGQGSTDGGATPAGRVFATATLNGVVTVVSGGAGSAPRGPVCSWTKSQFNTFDPGLDDLPVEVVESGTDGWYFDPVNDVYVDAPGPGIETLYWVACPSGISRYWWLPQYDAIDRQGLIDAAYAHMERDVPLPSLDMSPRPEIGGIVNLGLWLAVDDPGEVSAVAELGPVWAVTTARFAGMTWDMGNGDLVDCDGLGVPYPEGSNQIAQGPCGYTYTEQPPADGYTITATGRWEVQLVTSDGVNQTLAPIEMEFSFAYDVNEIITTGVA